jgi:hypothetical protein
MPTFTQIGSAVTVGALGSSTISFTSIPSTYTDLVLLTSIRTSRADAIEDSVKIEFNGITTGYSRRSVRGDGTFTTSLNASDALFLQNQNTSTTTANTFTNASTYIPNYAGSQNKSLSVDSAMENNATTAYANLVAGLWSNTAAITSILLTPNVGLTFLQHTTAYLYGVSNA